MKEEIYELNSIFQSLILYKSALGEEKPKEELYLLQNNLKKTYGIWLMNYGNLILNN